MEELLSSTWYKSLSRNIIFACLGFWHRREYPNDPIYKTLQNDPE